MGVRQDQWSNPKQQGDSEWKPTPGTKLYTTLAKYGKTSIQFKKSYPVFEPFSYNEDGVKAVVDIGYFQKPKKPRDDMKRARDKYRNMLKATGVPNADSWPWPPKNSACNAPADWSWHHHEDGKTMVLVAREIHDKTIGGVNHCGGIQCL